jgi:hypothetical protein
MAVWERPLPQRYPDFDPNGAEIQGGLDAAFSWDGPTNPIPTDPQVRQQTR